MEYRGYKIRKVDRVSHGKRLRYRATKGNNVMYGETLSDIKKLINSALWQEKHDFDWETKKWIKKKNNS